MEEWGGVPIGECGGVGRSRGGAEEYEEVGKGGEGSGGVRRRGEEWGGVLRSAME